MRGRAKRNVGSWAPLPTDNMKRSAWWLRHSCTDVPRVPLAWTVHYGRNVQLVGWPGAADRIEVDGDIAGFDATVRCYDGDDLVGAVCLGRPAAGRALRTEIEQTLAAEVVA